MGENSISNFSTKFFRGQGNSSGRKRNIAEGFAKTLGQILEKFVCSKFHQNRITIYARRSH